VMLGKGRGFSIAMLPSVRAAIQIICHLVDQSATRRARLEVLEDRLAQWHAHVISAGELSATFLTQMLLRSIRGPNSLFGCSEADCRYDINRA
jgi:hypothetical protein